MEWSGDRLVVRFDGRLTEEEGARSARALIEAMGERSCALTFDIRKMDGYDSRARQAWQAALAPLKSQVAQIELVGGNPIVRMGGQTLGLLTGIPVTAR